MLLATSGPGASGTADGADRVRGDPHAVSATSQIQPRKRGCYHLARAAPPALCAAVIMMPLAQALGRQRSLDRGAIGDPRLVVIEVGIQAEVDALWRAPLQEGEQVRVGDRERLAHQERPVLEHVLQVEQPPADLAPQ